MEKKLVLIAICYDEDVYELVELRKKQHVKPYFSHIKH